MGVGVISAGVFLAIEWPRAVLASSPGSLADIRLKGIAQNIVQTTAMANGSDIPISQQGGEIVPTVKLRVSTPVTVTVTLERPPWISWLTGKTEKLTTQVVTPVATLLNPVSIGALGDPVLSYFSTPVRVVSVSGSNGTTLTELPVASSRVPLKVSSHSAGTLDIAATPDTWEVLPSPSQLVYFRNSSKGPIGILNPNVTSLTPEAPISITLSQRISSAFGTKLPTLAPAIKGALLPKGTWSRPTPYSLLYTPTSPDFWPSEHFTIQLPGKVALALPSGALGAPTSSILIQGASPSITRVQQLLAQLNYLPLSWTPAVRSSVPTYAQQAQLTLKAPSGSFSWRWAMPSPLTSLWQAGSYNVITRGAVMSFEQFNGLNTVGLANPLLWPTLLNDIASHKVDPHRYSWIEVQKSLPQTLYLYENGSVVLTSPTNTGIQGLSTTNGTFPIYLRFAQNYMSGTNPNGSTYHDLVYWVNYFLGSEAVHGFPRAQYGYQQSLGCVELPVSTAATIYKEVHIGTLTTVLPS